MKVLLLAIAGGYLAFAGGLFLLQRGMLYHPDPTRRAPAEFDVPDMHPVTLRTADGLNLLAWWCPPDGDAPVLVFFHGNAGHIGYRGGKVRPYLDRGWGVLLTAWRGYSGNPGSPTEAGLYADGRAALAFLRERGIPPARQVVYGESLGAAVAVELARRIRFGALVLESAFTSVADIGQSMYPFLPVRLLVRDKFESIRKIAEVVSPLLIIHGEDDAVVPASHGRRLLAAAQGPKSGQFIAGAGHNDLYGADVAAKVIEFAGRYDLK